MNYSTEESAKNLKQIVPYRKKDKWGFAKLETKEIMIPIIYEAAKPFEQNLLGRVKLDGVWGMVDQHGNMLVENKFEEIANCHEGFSRFKLNNQYGFLNTKGQIAIAAKFDDAWHFSQGLAAVVIDSKVGFINTHGEIVIQAIYDHINYPWEFEEDNYCVVRRDGKYGCVDSEGNEFILCEYEKPVFFSAGQDITAVKLTDRTAFIEVFGTDFDYTNPVQIIEEEMDNLQFFAKDKNGNMLEYEIYQKLETQSNFYKFINKRNEFVSAEKYENATRFIDGLAAIQKEGKWGIIDTNFNIIINPEYEDIEPFSEGLAPIKKNGLWGFINPQGQLIIDHKYYRINNGFFKGFAKVERKNGKELFIDKNGVEWIQGLMVEEEWEEFSEIHNYYLKDKIIVAQFSWSDEYIFLKYDWEQGIRENTLTHQHDYTETKNNKFLLEPIWWCKNYLIDSIELEPYDENLFCLTERNEESKTIGYVDTELNEYWEDN